MNGHILPGGYIAVDFWNTKGCQHRCVHFLSHIHGDHIVGLTSTWTEPIYCSDVTADILCAHYGIPTSLLRVLPLYEPVLIPLPHSKKTFCVTAFNANHCPGALMFYFQGDMGNIFYTGDFRYSQNTMSSHLEYLHGKVDILYMDNTFCSPLCKFPSREECLSQIVDLVKQHPNHNILIGVRKLGKEDLLVKLGLALDETVYVSPQQLKIIQYLYSTNIFATILEAKDQRCRISTIPFHKVSTSFIKSLNETTPTIAILPSAIFTGLPTKPFSKNPHIYVVPFSDHSSFPELVDFVTQLKPSRIVPVVTSKRGPFGLDISDRQDMSCFNHLLNLRLRERSDSYNEHVNGTNSLAEYIGSGTPGMSLPDEFVDFDSPFSLSSQNCIVQECHPDEFNGYSFQRRSSDSNLLGNSQTRLKRKRSYPLSKRRKIAKGVCYTDDSTIKISKRDGLCEGRKEKCVSPCDLRNISDSSCAFGNQDIDETTCKFKRGKGYENPGALTSEDISKGDNDKEEDRDGSKDTLRCFTCFEKREECTCNESQNLQLTPETIDRHNSATTCQKRNSHASPETRNLRLTCDVVDLRNNVNSFDGLRGSDSENSLLTSEVVDIEIYPSASKGTELNQTALDPGASITTSKSRSEAPLPRTDKPDAITSKAFCTEYGDKRENATTNKSTILYLKCLIQKWGYNKIG